VVSNRDLRFTHDTFNAQRCNATVHCRVPVAVSFQRVFETFHSGSFAATYKRYKPLTDGPPSPSVRKDYRNRRWCSRDRAVFVRMRACMLMCTRCVKCKACMRSEHAARYTHHVRQRRNTCTDTTYAAVYCATCARTPDRPPAQTACQMAPTDRRTTTTGATHDARLMLEISPLIVCQVRTFFFFFFFFCFPPTTTTSTDNHASLVQNVSSTDSYRLFWSTPESGRPPSFSRSGTRRHCGFLELQYL
jgi:hypothetical protein